MCDGLGSTNYIFIFLIIMIFLLLFIFLFLKSFFGRRAKTKEDTGPRQRRQKLDGEILSPRFKITASARSFAVALEGRSTGMVLLES